MASRAYSFCLGLIAVSTAATAAPFAPPAPAIEVAIRAYAHAIRTKDSAEYESLLAGHVKVGTPTGKAMGKQAWMQQVSREFSHPDRRVTIKNIFAGTGAAEGVEQVSFVEEVSECPPVISECGPFWQIETLTFDDAGKVTSLNRSSHYLMDLWPWVLRPRI